MKNTTGKPPPPATPVLQVQLMGKRGTLPDGTPNHQGVELKPDGSLKLDTGLSLPSALPPTGAAGGDLGGSYPNPTVVQGVHLAAASVPDAALSANVALHTDKLSAFAATSSAELAGVLSDETGTNKLVFSDSPTLVTPALGTPSALVLTNATGLPVASLTGQVAVANGGTGLATLTAHAVQVGNGASSPTQLGVGASGTVLQGTAASDPAFTATPTLGVTGSVLGQISLAGSTSGTTIIKPNVAAGSPATLTLPNTTDTLVGKATTDTLTNKTLTSPTMTAPVLGTPTSGTLTNCTGLPVASLTGQVAVANGGTGLATLTAHALQVGNGTSAVTQIALPTEQGQILQGVTSADPGWSPTVTLGNNGGTGGTLTIKGATSGRLILAPAAATAQIITLATAAQTTGAATLTIPDMAGASDTLSFLAKAETLTNKTLTAPTLTAPVLGTPASGDLSNCTALNATQLTSGTIPTARLNTGYGTIAAGTDITTTSNNVFVTTGLSATIQPTSASNKIVIQFSSANAFAAATGMYFGIKRNGTLITSGTNNYVAVVQTATDLAFTRMLIDAPASTSSLTYELFFFSNNGTAVYFLRSAGSLGSVDMLLTEIKP